MKKNGIKHIFTAPYHPLSNGMAERSVQNFKNAKKKIIERKQCLNLNTTIYRFLLHYRSTPQIATGKSPAELLFNRKINTRLNLLRYSLNKQNLKPKENLAEFYTSNMLSTFTPGHTIWCRNFQKWNKWERGIVIKKAGSVTYLIDSCYGIFQKLIDQLLFAYVNTDIDLKDDNLENTIDNGTQNEHQSSLPIPTNEKESKLQNEPPVSSSQLYIQLSIVPEISNSTEPQTPQPSQSQNNRDEYSANINKPNPDPVLHHSQCIRNPPAYLKDYFQ